MSVFHNIYTQKYEESTAYQTMKKYAEDFNFFDTALTTVINSLSWKKLPDEKLPYFMPEVFLQYSGRLARYEENGQGKLHACFPNGQLTENGDFTAYTIVKPNGETLTRKADEIEVCFNNCFKMPYVYKITQFSDKMSYAIRAVDTALAKACMPTIALFDTPEQLKKYDIFTNPETAMRPFVAMLKEGLVPKELETLDIYDSSKVDVLALWDVYVRYRNLFYTTFGINNVEVQKKERLTEAEGSGNDEITRYSLLDDMYNQRKDFIDRCHKHFGDNMEIEINRDIATVFELTTDNSEKLDLAKLDFTKGTNPANPDGENPEEPQEEKTEEPKGAENE